MAEAEKLVARFRDDARVNKVKSRAEGREVFDNREVVEIFIPGDTQRKVVQPAHHVWKWENGEPITFAMRFSAQYNRFKAGKSQIADGTPLSSLPFLNAGQRSTLSALNVHTAELLASLSGDNLKKIGMGGQELKAQAKAFLDAASGTADVTAMAARNADLQRQIDELKTLIGQGGALTPAGVQGEPAADEPESPFATYSVEELRSFYADASGQGVRGQPSHATLVRMCEEVQAKREAA